MIHITADSRQIKKGDIFVAIKGFSSDGHDYIEKAIENGASKIIAEHGSYSIPYEIVDNSREYLLNYLKENYLPLFKKMKFIGITGTNGKTTTAYLAYKALRNLGYKSAYIGTIGFFLEDRVNSLANSSPDIWDTYNMFLKAYENGCEYVFMEVSSHALSFGRIEGYDFDIALFTNLTQDHLDYHKTMENYALAKQKLFKKLKKNGKAIINVDDGYKDYYLLDNNINITYGFNESDYKVIDYKMDANGTAFSYMHNNNKVCIKTNLIGKYNVYNALAAITILTELGISDEKIMKVMPTLPAPLGRMDRISYKNNNIIIDYAHTPDALEKLINTVKEISKGKIYVIFGCTGDRDRTKRPKMFDIVTSLTDKAIITNDDPHFEDPNQIVSDILDGAKNNNYEVCLDRKKAIIKGINLLKENDILLILGKGHEEVMIIGNERIPFNDRKVVEEYISDKVTM